MLPWANSLYKVFTFLYRATAVLAGMLLLVITLLGTIDVVGRDFFNQPMLGQVEIARVLLAYVVFLGLAHAETQGAHVQLLLLDRYLSPRWQNVRAAVALVLAIATMALASYATWVAFWNAWVVQETMIAPIRVYTWWAKLALPVGCVLFTVELVFALLRRMTRWSPS